MLIKFGLALCILGGSVYAPFPKGHQLNWANPIIDPVWDQLEPETRKTVYNSWLSKEPQKLALMDYLEYSDRRKLADSSAWSEAKELFKATKDELGYAFHNGFKAPSYTSDVEMKGTKEKPGKVKTTSRHRIGSQIHWEKFMSAFQLALHIRLAEKRAFYQYMLEKVRKHGEKKKDGDKNLKRNAKVVKNKVKGSYFKFLDKYQEKLYKLWSKAEKVKKDAKKEAEKFGIKIKRK